MSESAFPLYWPDGWPRAKGWRLRAAFGERRQGVSMTTALDGLEKELSLLGGTHHVVSSNMQARLDGRPYANQGNPADPGVAVYFTLNKRRVVLACDKWDRLQENIWAIVKHISALRGQKRWGVGTTEQAFAGYTALAEKTEPTCWETLKIPPGSSDEQIMDAYRRRARETHPDHGGNAESFSEVVRAKDTALAMRKQVAA